jgi:hypothetical protein
MDEGAHPAPHVPPTSTLPSNSLSTANASQNATPLQPTNAGGSSLQGSTHDHHHHQATSTIATTSNTGPISHSHSAIQSTITDPVNNPVRRPARDPVRGPAYFLNHDKARILNLIMDGRRHPPSTFQQLEKLGEGTYATVRNKQHPFFVCIHAHHL